MRGRYERKRCDEIMRSDENIWWLKNEPGSACSSLSLRSSTSFLKIHKTACSFIYRWRTNDDRILIKMLFHHQKFMIIFICANDLYDNKTNLAWYHIFCVLIQQNAEKSYAKITDFTKSLFHQLLKTWTSCTSQLCFITCG